MVKISLGAPPIRNACYFWGRRFFTAPGVRVPFSGRPPFFGARLAAPVFTAGRLDADCRPVARFPSGVRTTRAAAAPAPAGPSRRGARASSRVRGRAISLPRSDRALCRRSVRRSALCVRRYRDRASRRRHPAGADSACGRFHRARSDLCRYRVPYCQRPRVSHPAPRSLCRGLYPYGQSLDYARRRCLDTDLDRSWQSPLSRPRPSR
jgi:hypothetical protein